MENKFNFVYLTTNLINGKQYVGDHSTNNENLDTNYFGSGRPYFKRALNEYGRENFKREELEFFSTKKEAFDAQEKYIIKYNTLVPNGYNISPKGGLNVKGCFSEETKKIISTKVKKTLTGRHLKESTKKLLSKIMLEKKIKRSEEFKNKIRLKNKNKIHTEQSKENMRKGRIDLIMPKRHKYTLISPNNEIFIFYGENDLYHFIIQKNMSIRLIRGNFNKGKIKIRRTSILTKNTENWEIKKESLFKK
jgi:group I intron endonuclease